jgi:hypothetical protein
LFKVNVDGADSDQFTSEVFLKKIIILHRCITTPRGGFKFSYTSSGKMAFPPQKFV